MVCLVVLTSGVVDGFTVVGLEVLDAVVVVLGTDVVVVVLCMVVVVVLGSDVVLLVLGA